MLYMYQIFIYDLQRQKKHTKIRGGASRQILGVSSFLFCSGIGGVERGESTGARADNGSL